MELKKFRADDDSVLLFGTNWEHHTGNTGHCFFLLSPLAEAQVNRKSKRKK